MNRYLRCEPVCIGWRLALAALFLLLTLGAARGVTLVEEFYLPLPEDQVLLACKAITPAVTDTNFASITALLVTSDGTQIYYDQWEDGYEPNLASPTNSSTLIWGDGNNANGIAPGFTNDPAGLPTGTVLILSNAVASSPRVQSQVYYDGRDRIGANKALVVTRAGWPYPTGPVFGGSAVVQATIDWGTNYVSPIGQDMTENLFKYVGFLVMASQNNTVVIVDPDGPGPLLATTNTLSQGQSWLYSGGVRRGGTVSASKPVEAHLVCGDTVSTYAIDWFTLYPQADWSSSYYTPLPSIQRGATLYLTDLYFYNATATPITIQYTNLYATNTFVIPATGGYKFIMPTNSGGVFASAGGEKFTVLCTVANSSTDDTSYNWGFTPLPKGSLTTEADAGWSPGSSDYTQNGSPVWVTPTAATRIYVDYRGDHAGPLTDPNGGKYDTNFNLVNFQSQRIYVPGTNDQTALRVYTLDGTLLSVVWGQDPAVAGTGNPYLDLGNPVLPFPVPRLTKSAVIVTDAPPAGLSIGDTLLYTVQVDNKGLLPLGNTVVIDAPPPSLSYLTNSATLNGAAVPDSTSGTAFPLDAPGYTIPIILSGGTSVFQYMANIVATGSVVNAASIPGYNVNVTNTVPVAAVAPSFFVSKTIVTPSSGVVGVGQTMQFNLQVINNGNIPLTNVVITDNYPSNKFSYVTASPAPNSAGNGQILWTNLGAFAVGQVTNLTVTLLATNTAAIATNTLLAVAPGNTTNSSSVAFTNVAAPVAAVTVNKTLLSPATPKAGVGQTVQFNLQAYNSGFAVLTNLSLADNFPRTNFSFVSATVTPNLITASNLVWTNLGSFTPGQLTNIVVNFIVTNYSANVTNYAVAASVGGATNTDSSILQVSRSGLSVTKTVLSPTNQTVPLGSNVTFRIRIQNTGQLAITNLPFEDTFSPSLFTYVSATIPPNSVTPGNLYWTNLAGVGGMATNVIITNDVTLRVAGGATPAYNTAAANFAIDVNNTAVAPASSVVGVNTAAGSISGKAYSDPDQSGTLTGGDSPLDGVTLSLYTDPNGDGNPADGTLQQTVASDSNGYYELLNLSTGAFVVVQTVLPGYTGTAPVNNRLAILISSLTAATNQNFFQYQIPTTNYATVNGTVWNDVNGVGFYQAGDFGLTNAQVDLIQDLNSNGVVDIGETVLQSALTTTNGTYFFSGVAPGRYLIRETDLPGYISTGDSQGTNDNQIAVALGSGVTTNGNDFFDFYFGLGNTNSPPVAVPDFTNTLQNVLVVITPLPNDNSPGGYALTITNVAATNGIATIVGGTNVSFTPAAFFTGTATIGYTVTNANGKSTSLITITVSPVADVRIGKTGPASVLALSNLTYTISVTNFGPSSASSVTVTDALPNNITFVSASGGGVTNGSFVTWSLGTLSSNQTSNVTVTVTAPAGGTLTNSASVGSPTADTNTVNNTTPPVITTVTPLADLVIAKTGPAGVNVLSNFSYTISVTNLGPSSASSVTVTDALPVGVTFSSASGNGTNLGGNVVWNLGTLAAAQATNLTLTVTAPANGATLTNIAWVGSPTGDTNVLNNTNPPVITSVTPVADVSVTKTGPAGIIFGTNYNYSITVSNAGPSTATSLILTDSLPSGLAFVSSVPSTTTNAGSQVIWNLGSLAANTASNLTLTVISTQRGSLTNFASGGSPTPDPTPTNNVTPPVVTLVTNFPPLANPDSASMTENTTNTVSPLVNDVIRTPGGSLTILSVTPTNGTASISGTNVIFVPTLNFNGVATIGYVITDNVGGTNSSVITITVTNIPPIANPDGYAVFQNSTNTFSPLTNDVVRTIGGTLSIIGVSPTNGTATISGTNIIFTPTPGFTGTATIGYTITDGIGGTNATVITVNVSALADIAVSKTGAASVYAATNFDYTITVTNFGPGTAVSLSVTDNLSASVTFVSSTVGATLTGSQLVWTNLGSLAANAGTNLTITVTAPLTSMTLTNVATGGSPTSDPNPTNNTSPPVTTAVTPVANLVIAKTAPASVVATSNLTYTISVTNLGPSSASSVTVTDTLPGNVTFVSASGGGVNAGSFVTWSLGTLSSNQTSNVTVTVTAPVSGTLTNFASISSPTLDPSPTNNTTPPVLTTVTPQADLQIGKTGVASVLAVSNLTYTISVTNFGPSPASSVTVTDALPAGVSFVSASGNGANNSGLVTWSIATLSSNQVTNLTVTVTAPASGSLTNIASVGTPTNDPNPTNNTTPPVITTVTPLADLLIAKTGPASVSAASSFSYTISVTNFGPSSASSVTVTDTLPAGVTFSSASGNGTNVGGNVIWNLGTMTAAQATNLTLTVTAPNNGTTLTNVANVSSPTGDTNVLNNTTPPVVTTVTPVADVSVFKSGPAGALFNTNYNYSITVTNGGPSTATSLIVTDSLPVGLAFASSVPATTTNASNQVLWNLGSLSANTASNLTLTVISTQRGSLTNFASGGSPVPDPTPTNNITPPVVTSVTNFPPVANPDGYTVLENSTNTFSPLTNDVVRNPGGVLSIISVTPTNGTATISGTNVIFTPTNNFIGTATIGYTITDGVGGTNSSVITVTVLAVADIAVSKSGPTNVFAATNFDYTITVTNAGPGPAASLSVTDSLPTLVSFVSASAGGTLNGGQVIWSLGSLAANAATNLSVTVTAPITSASLTNVATGGTPTSDPNPTNNTSPPVVTTVTPIANLAVGKVGPATVIAVSNLTYTISVTNFGPSAASSVTVTDALPNGVTFVSATGGGVTNNNVVSWNFGTLTSNQVSSVSVTVTAPASGLLTNTANVNSPVSDPTPTNNTTPPVITTVTTVADLQIGKVGPATVFAVSNLTYTISVTNFGPSSASSVTVTDALPAGVTFVSASSGGLNNSGVVSWTLGTLSSNQVTNVTVTVTAPPTGSLTNTASVSTPTGDPNPTNNVTPPVTTTVTPLADVQIGKVGPAAVFAVSNLTYTISVTNFGPSSASSVTVTDALPAGVTFVSASSGGLNNSGVVSWALGTLSSNQVTNVTVTVTAPAGGALTNTATVNSPTGDPVPTNNVTPPVITTVTPLADVSVVKTGPAGIIFGTNYDYSITVSNGGPSTATSLIVTDSLPVGLAFVSSVPSTTTNASNQVIWNLGSLAANTASNLTLTVISTQRGSLTNFASGGSPTPDPTPTNNATPPVVTLVTNFPPLANPDSASMTENTTNTVSPLINDVIRTPGGTLTILSVTPTNGTASISGTNVIFVPTLNFTGIATIGYVITDNVGGTNSSVITITVTNIPPIANPDSYAMTENTTNALPVLVNDVVLTPGGSLAILSVTPTNGTASISGTNIIFTPTLNFLGTATIGYTITDGIGGTNSSVATVVVTNIPPLANPDSYTMAENTTNTFSPLANDVVRTPGGVLSIISVSPTNGAASIIGGTNVTFIPTLNFVGVTTIGYTITDGIGGTNSSVITVTVTNQSPIAFPQTLSTTENVALPITLTGFDPVGRPLTFIIVSAPAGGTLTGLNTNTGAVTYTPTNNFTGTDTFVFRVNNGVNNSSNATITINVTPTADLLVQQSGPTSGVAGNNLVFTVAVTNLGPATATNVVVTNQIAAGYTFISASGNGTTNGNLVTWTIPTLPANGATNLTVTLLAMEGGTFTNIASGSNATLDLNSTNNDGSLTNAQVITTVSASANLAITKSGPANVNATGSVTYNLTVTNGGPSTATGVIVTDALPTSVSFVSASGNGVNNSGIVTWNLGSLANGAASNLTVTVTAPASGTLTNIATIGSPTPDPTPTNNITPPVVTTVTTIADLAVGKSGAASSALNANFTYTISVTNLGPSTAANFAVTDSLPVGIVFVSSVPSVTTNATSQVIWTNLGTLALNATTNLTLTVRAVTRGAVTNFATVGGPTVDGTPTNNTSPQVITSITNRPPLAVDDSGSTSKNVSITVPVLVNDSDADGDALTIVSVAATNGTAIISGTNVVFTPTNNFIGTALIGYTITDGFGGTNSALISINVTNRAPVAVNDSASTPKNVAVTIPVLVNDSDVDGDALTIVSVAATNGFASIGGTNVIFTPTNNFLGTAFIGYTISDGFGGTASALITVTVTNRAPVAVNDSGSTPKNVAVTIPALVNDSDPDGDVLAIISVAPTNGTAIISGTNVVFTPATNFIGTAIVGYRITDGFGSTNVALITITVTNRAPVAVNDSATTPKNVAVTIPVLANDSDPDGDALTIVSVAATNGFAVISGTNVVFTPTNNFLGTTFLGYVIRDNFGGTNSALITVTVTNRAPVAVDDSRGTAKNIAVTIPALANDSDPDGDALTIVSVSPTNGTANISGTNVVFTPATNFLGTATIGYTITDGFGGTNSALITVTITNRAPVANAQSTNTTFNTAKALTLTGSDPDGDALTFIIVTSPGGGTLTGLNTNTGAVIYTPTNNFVGTDTFTFRVNDGTADSATATVSITVGTPVIADLVVFKTGPTNGIAGSNIVYSITVTNLGTSAATNVVVSDTLPAGFIFVSAVPTNSSLVGNVVNWSVFKLGANGKTNFTLTARSLEGGTFTNFASATSDAYDPNPTSNNGTLTNSQVRTLVAALADVQVFKDGGTNVAAGATVTYTITATNAGPSTATNVVVKDNLPPGSTFQTASGSYTVSNNVVTWSPIVLTNGASVDFTIALTAPASGTFTNIALATSPTPDPNATNNNGSLNKARVATKIVPVADLIVLLYGPTNAVQGSNFVYSLILSNAGPSVASNAITSDQLPTNFVFVSATSGGVFSNGIVKWPKVAHLVVGGTTNYFITVNSPFVGTFTNFASAISDTLDPNPTNNTGVAPASQALTTVSVADLSWFGGTPIFNPQTGLYEETVIVTNNGNGTIAGFWLYVTVLTPNVQLWNATGTNGGVPYVQYSSPLDPSNHVSLILEFYDPLRVPFTNTLNVVPVIPANIGNIGTNGSVEVNKVFTDTRTNGTRFVIEFVSVPGKTYTIIYSSDLGTWKVATPSVTANANVTQWYDDGPPKTESLPADVNSRFYRVIKN